MPKILAHSLSDSSCKFGYLKKRTVLLIKLLLLYIFLDNAAAYVACRKTVGNVFVRIVTSHTHLLAAARAPAVARRRRRRRSRQLVLVSLL